MLVLDLMNSNENWREVLSDAPYNVKIKEENDYVLLKYNQLNSDFSNPIVRECRGSIFRQESGKWICVCRAFDKFGNVGQDYVPEINWLTASIQEKVDGSLMKVWNDKGFWHLSTNGNIDAFKTPLGDFDMSFGDYFMKCLGGISFMEFAQYLDPNYCYMYEMVGPKNRVVVEYKKPMLYGLGRRNMKTMKEEQYKGPIGAWCNITVPKVYALFNMDEVIKIASFMDKDEEGFVVCDGNFNRVKVKSAGYLVAAGLRNNGVITYKRVLDMLLNDQLDDFLAYCPQYEDEVNEVVNDFNELIYQICEETLKFLEEEPFGRERIAFAMIAKKYRYNDYFFRLLEDRELLAEDYVRRQRRSVILRMLAQVRKDREK